MWASGLGIEGPKGVKSNISKPSPVNVETSYRKLDQICDCNYVGYYIHSTSQKWK